MTPEDWRNRLVSRLDARWNTGINRQEPLSAFDAYYEGDQTLAYATRKFNQVYGGLFRSLTDNWMPLVVDSSAERLRVQGFRFGQQDADDEAWDIWQRNGLDGEANMLHTEAIKLSEAYWMVQPNGKEPIITAEHPSQVIVHHAPGDRRNRLAALKKWQDDEGLIRANVYLPDRVVKYRTNRAPELFEGIMAKELRWETIGATGNPLGVVPIVPAPNNPSMLYGGRSDLAGGPISIQNAINKLIADMLIGAEYQAFPQRVLLGVDQPRGPDGKPIPMNKLDEVTQGTRLWMFPGKDAKAFEFQAADLVNFRSAIDGLVRDLTAQSRTPPHYVAGQIVNASGDALKAAETGLVSKVKDKMDPFGEAHEEAIRLAFKSIDPDDPRASDTNAETIWRDPESRSDAEKVDAATKKAAIGVPWEQLMEDLGYSPQQIDRMAAMKEADALTAESFVPTAMPIVPGSEPATPAPTPTDPAAPGTP